MDDATTLGEQAAARRAGRGASSPAVVWLRVFQFVLDGALVWVPLAALSAGVLWLFGPDGPALLTFVRAELITGMSLGTVCSWVLMTWWAYRHGGQTPAMRLLRLRVRSIGGGLPPLRVFVIRQVCLVVDGAAWGLVGLGLMSFTRHHQRLGDLVTRSVVARVPRENEIRDQARPKVRDPGNEITVEGRREF